MGEDLTEADFGPERIEEVRAEVRRLMAEQTLKPALVAKEAGVGGSTLAAWLGGTYVGDNAKQALTMQRWITGRAARQIVARTAPRAPDFVLTPTAEAFASVFEHAHYSPDVDVIVGDPGLGKTSAARQYAKVSASAWHVTILPNAGSVSWVMAAVADALGINSSAAGGAFLNRAVARRLTGIRGLLLIDEAQNCSMQALDLLRSFHDLCGVGVVFMGNRSIVRRMEGRADFAQLSSRIGMRVDRRKPAAGDIEMLLDAWGIEDSRVRVLAKAVARRDGALRRMTKVLRQAHLRATEDGGVVLPAHVEDAARQLVDDRPLEVEA